MTAQVSILGICVQKMNLMCNVQVQWGDNNSWIGTGQDCQLTVGLLSLSQARLVSSLQVLRVDVSRGHASDVLKLRI